SGPEAQLGVLKVRPPLEPQAECNGSCFRRPLYALPEPGATKLWECSGCRAQNFKISDEVCRQCGSKSPSLLAREDCERRRQERERRHQEKARAEREENGTLTMDDMRLAYEEGIDLDPFK
ncbi:unnamed protein product, partial [Polarella glacialis]